MVWCMSIDENGAGDAARRPPRDLIRERIDRLETLRVGHHRTVDEDVRRHLIRWRGPNPDRDEVVLRTGYLRRPHPLVEGHDYDPGLLVDRPKPVLPHVPPLAALAGLNKGVALQLSLTTVALIQAATRKTLAKDGLLKLPIEAAGDQSFGLLDFLAVPSVHRPSPHSTLVSNLRINRKRQIRSGLAQLDTLGLVELPAGGRKGAPRFHRVYVKEDVNPRAAGAKPYTTPQGDAEVVSIPWDFYVHGWIHSLSKSEIAMWLMLRDLAQRSDRTFEPGRLYVSGRKRLLEYDLSRAMWDTHASLEEFGLIVVHKDPSRRANGTTVDGERAAPHFFELRDEGLREDGLTTVLTALTERQGRAAS